MAVILETSLGDITVDLYTDERPICCRNFLKLCKIKYYNFCLFHSVQRNLVAQTGDPTGTGRGGESVFGTLYGEQARYFEAEVKPRIKHNNVGTVSMVNNGNNMHGSQFFITTGESLDYLDNVHTVFGEVSEGLETIMKINEAVCDKENRPYQDIRIYHTVILDDPFDDPPGLVVPSRSPSPTKEMLDSGRIGADEEIDDTKGKTETEVAEMMEEREEKANAQILEMIGDLPDADVKPPDNVLFVCKLNPVTTSEDLEIIFSRFGNILSCEVITDQKTQESLQYAFIEFEKPEECENAYFKMDNVLIDDRRIHVDFSQSVSKVKWKGKGKGVEYPKQQGEPRNAPKYKLKDTKRKDDGYELLYSSDDENDSKKRSKKKKKKSDLSRSRSRERDSKKKASKNSRSRSPAKHRWSKYDSDDERDRGRKSDREKYRESGRERDRFRNRSQERGRERARESDREKDRYRDRSRDRGRDRDRESDRERGRNRSPDDRKSGRRRERERSTELSRDKHRNHSPSEDRYRRERSRSAEKSKKDKYRGRSRSR